MTVQTDGELSFGIAYAPDGFTSAAVSQFDGSAEPVVRELIQNCLDAAHKAGRAAEVRFVLTDVVANDLPGWAEYCQAFKEAKKERKQRRSRASHDEKAIIGHIDALRCANKIPVMLCVDNGCGLDPQRMISLLTVGNTDKGEGGAGSFGLGHHAAFGASDLRYVLYGSRYARKKKMRTISSGHAILATRTDGKGEILAPEGYWRRSGWSGRAWSDGSEFPSEVPSMLALHLPEDTTGTVVAIAGFNDFRRDNDESSAEEQIMQVAAANFSAAIDEERLIVEVIDPRGGRHVTDRATLDATLAEIADRRRASKAGQIAGAQANAAWLTLRDGAELTPLPGVKVKWRPLDAARGEQTQVHVFRKGMWIDSRVDRLLRRDFTSTWPFDAVVTLSDGELEELVRASEGPEHRGVDRKRLSNEQKSSLRQLLTQVAEALKEAVGDRDDEEEYTPQSFAILNGHHVRTAEAVARPRRQGGGGHTKTRVVRGEKKAGGGRGERRRGTPRPGSIPNYRHVLRADADSGIVEVRLNYDEDVDDRHAIGIRVRRASGADGTCEQPFPDDYLPLASAQDSAGNVASTNGAGGELELELPAATGERTLRITLADDEARELAASPHLLSIDIVKRVRPSSAETGAAAETNGQTPSTTTRDVTGDVLESRA